MCCVKGRQLRPLSDHHLQQAPCKEVAASDILPRGAQQLSERPEPIHKTTLSWHSSNSVHDALHGVVLVAIHNYYDVP